MAYTTSLIAQTVFGNERIQHWRWTADAATGVVTTGLDYIYNINTACQSCSTAALKFAINELCAGTASVGSVGVSGAASGDEVLVTVYGR